MLLKVCANGARRLGEHPYLPVSPDDIATDVAGAVVAGAAAAHVHVKDEAGVDTFDAVALQAVLTTVRAAAPGVPVGVTTGAWAMPELKERIEAIRSWTALPDFASVNWHDDGADEVAGALLTRGIGVEAGLWHLKGVDAWLRSPYRDDCLRILIELPDGLDENQTAAEADRLLRRVHGGVDPTVSGTVPVLLHGEGSSCWPALRLALQLGLDTRIGLEDTLELPDGAPAPGNTALVEAAVALAAARG